jgi:hypothetical protein
VERIAAVSFITSWLLGSKLGRTVLLYGSVILTVVLFLLYLRKSGEKAGRMAERVATQVKTLETKDAQLKAAAAAPRGTPAVVDSLRDGRF